MDITHFIAELLNQNDEVSIPGFGTFFRERVAGYYNQINKAFMPPQEKLSFRNSDSGSLQLTQYISKQKNLSETSTTYFIDKFISNLQDQLATSQYFEFKPLGIFRKQQDEFIFESAEDKSLQKSFFGLVPIQENLYLSSNNAIDSKVLDPVIKPVEAPASLNTVKEEIQKFNIPPIISSEIKQREVEVINSVEIPYSKPNEVEIPIKTTSLLHELVLGEPEVVAEGPEESKAFKYIQRVALVLAIAGVLSTFVAYFFFPGVYKIMFQPGKVIEKFTEKKKAAPLPLPVDLLDSLAEGRADSIVESLQPQSPITENIDTTSKISNKDTVKVIKETPTKIIVKETPTKIIAKEPEIKIIAKEPEIKLPTYEIIAASLNSQKEAKRIISNFKSLGVAASIVYAPKKRKNKILISIGSYKTNAEAEKELLRVKKKIEKDAYIFKKTI